MLHGSQYSDESALLDTWGLADGAGRGRMTTQDLACDAGAHHLGDGLARTGIGMVNQEDSGFCRVALLTLALVLVLAMAGEALLPATLAAERQRSRDGVNAEVVGGQPVAQGTYRFMTFVRIDLPGGTFRCGGSLIAPRFVLTAAHCVEDADAEDVTLTIGRAVLTNGGNGVVRGVVDVALHPDWNPQNSANDVAVLELDAAVPESVARPVALIGGGETRLDAAGQPVAVAGWGRTSENGLSTDQLRAANLNVVSNATCADAYGGSFIQAVMVCAAFSGRDSCQGDSGGPLFARERIGFAVKKEKKKKGHKRKNVRIPIYRDVQMGIVSFGIGCANPNFPGVYTRLSAPGINDFIMAEIHP
jgi:secreted trypsin-like serine protease